MRKLTVEIECLDHVDPAEFLDAIRDTVSHLFQNHPERGYDSSLKWLDGGSKTRVTYDPGFDPGFGPDPF